MKIKSEEYSITVTHDQLYNMCYDIRKALFQSINNHWVNHQSAWKKNESRRLAMIKSMSYACGYTNIYDSIEEEVRVVFDNYNKKRGTSKS